MVWVSPGALRAPASSPNLCATADGECRASFRAGLSAPAPPVVHRQRSSGFIASIFGPDGPNREPQTTPAQFGSESIASGGKLAYPNPMDSDTIDEITAPGWSAMT